MRPIVGIVGIFWDEVPARQCMSRDPVCPGTGAPRRSPLCRCRCPPSRRGARPACPPCAAGGCAPAGTSARAFALHAAHTHIPRVMVRIFNPKTHELLSAKTLKPSKPPGTGQLIIIPAFKSLHSDLGRLEIGTSTSLPCIGSTCEQGNASLLHRDKHRYELQRVPST